MFLWSFNAIPILRASIVTVAEQIQGAQDEHIQTGVMPIEIAIVLLVREYVFHGEVDTRIGGIKCELGQVVHHRGDFEQGVPLSDAP